MANDSLTLARAKTLASKIERYWREKGETVRVWIEPIPLTSDE